MTAIGADQFLVAYDMLLVFGLSFIMWMIFHILRILIPTKSVAAAIVIYFLFFTAAGFFAFCFILGQTISQQPRWHMAAGFGFGALVYYAGLARYVRLFFELTGRLLRMLALPFVKLWAWFKRAVWGAFVLNLQNTGKKIYNKYTENRKKRRSKRGKGNEKEESKKEPVKAYTQN